MAIKNDIEKIIDAIQNRDGVVEYVNKIKKADEDLYSHSLEVARKSIMVAMKMNLPEIEIYEIAEGALLHDIGLSETDVQYKGAEQNKFTPEQMFDYKKHTVYGLRMVEQDLRICSEAKKIIMFHHEKKDKTGYPFSQDPQIFSSNGVKIVAVVDSYENRIAGIGHSMYSQDEAREYIISNQRDYFDGKIVDCFLKTLIEVDY